MTKCNNEGQPMKVLEGDINNDGVIDKTDKVLSKAKKK